MNKALEEAILRTKEYGRRFGVEYTDEEIGERLISEKRFKLRVKSYELRVSNVVKKKIDLARRLAKEIGENFSDILFIGVTGSVAAGYPLKDSDIDLMIVTRKNTLWLTRLCLRIWVWYRKVPHRKYGDQERIDEFCFNLWLEEDSLKLPKNKQNLKNAMDLILMKPILNKNNTYEKLVLENSWAKKWVATGYSRLVTSYELGVMSYDNNFLKKIINWVVFWPQWWYMRRKIGGGLVDRKRAFFHPHDKK